MSKLFPSSIGPHRIGAPSLPRKRIGVPSRAPIIEARVIGRAAVVRRNVSPGLAIDMPANVDLRDRGERPKKNNG